MDNGRASTSGIGWRPVRRPRPVRVDRRKYANGATRTRARRGFDVNIEIEPADVWLDDGRRCRADWRLIAAGTGWFEGPNGSGRARSCACCRSLHLRWAARFLRRHETRTTLDSQTVAGYRRNCRPATGPSTARSASFRASTRASRQTRRMTAAETARVEILLDSSGSRTWRTYIRTLF